ncbi:cation-translocating P-type ATPase [Moorena sp. SIO4G3]|uniref:cation-translocating P-type ATPase n=2 Tax=unclassified Moorena TaxID=2683338 RepID=UPI001429139C|nr:cation-translocating P-type ATPase [Moorena sp. SIO4G3]NEO81745.1 cation-translocating P-type ATPase [Moorena sp. SIO4G3]
MNPLTQSNLLPDPLKAWYTQSVENSLAESGCDPQVGLTSQQVSQRLQYYGLNELEEKAKRSSWAMFLDQFKDIMLLMLIAVAIVSGILDLINLQQASEKASEFPFKDTIAILSIVILNGILGYLQESRAEKALAALKSMASPKVRVLRDGRTLEIDSQQLVPGDMMLLEAGVQVGADGRLIEASNLQVRESALTGEANAVNKTVEVELSEDTPIGDRINLVFQGTEVVQGRGKVLVTGTGMNTELGKIAQMLQGVESEPTPLQQRMSQLGTVLVTGSLLLVALVIIIGLGVSGWDLSVFQQLVEVSLSMAVAVVPEGLPAVVTVTLALGTQRMVRRHALIRKLPAVETLGSVTTICSDKTGTLTQNKMVVQRVDTLNTSIQVTGNGYEPVGEFLLDNQPIATEQYPELEPLLLACALCNDAILQYEQGEWKILGDPTEGALIALAGKGGVDKEPLSQQYSRVDEIPFSSERKRMSVICQWDSSPDNCQPANLPAQLPYSNSKGEQPLPIGHPTRTTENPELTSYMMLTKGSPELVLEHCTSSVHNDDLAGGTLGCQPLTEDQRQQILEQNNQMAGAGLRVLGFAYKSLDRLSAPEADHETLEQGLVWLGLVGMLDAPRPEVREAVQLCRNAGIRPIMITGDHKLTARAIAQDLGIANQSDQVLTGQELQKLSQLDLEEQVDQVSIYARVAPEHKLRIVQALQGRGKFVAMTGDGVNDAPALKQADIGIAMGITGTDVSKEASDMVLLDDNFATIVAATEEGRTVYDNIRRFIRYILGSNIGEVLTIAAAPIMGLPDVPLTPLQILWMNLVTDGLPALALAVEPAEPDVMKRSPFSPRESIFARGLGSYMVRIGIVFAIFNITLMAIAYGYFPHWKTMVFTTLCIAQMGHALAVRSNKRMTLELNPFSNPYLLLAVTVTTLLQLLLVYVPFLQDFFGTEPLTMMEFAVCLGFSTSLFVWVELEKLFIRWSSKGKAAD